MGQRIRCPAPQRVQRIAEIVMRLRRGGLDLQRSVEVRDGIAGALPLIAWRLGWVGEARSRLLREGLHTCATCHSFSRDASSLTFHHADVTLLAGKSYRLRESELETAARRMKK